MTRAVDVLDRHPAASRASQATNSSASAWPGPAVHAPALIDAEISSVVRGLSITAEPGVRISAGRALEMLADYAGLRIVRHPMQPLQARAFEMRHNLSAYDAMYVAPAESLGFPLLTDDAKLAVAPGHTPGNPPVPQLKFRNTCSRSKGTVRTT